MSELTFFGYRRENNRVGIRNHVVILPLDDLSNAACEAVANNIKGTLALPHHYGRLQFGEDLELHFRTLIGTGANPNVAAVVVIGIEPGWTARVVDGIAKTGKPVQGFAIEQHGDIETIASASRVAKDFLQAASEARREECPISDLWVSHKCGESDTTSGMGANPTVGNFIDKTDAIGVTNCFGETSEITGAEHLCRERAINKEVGDKWFATWEAYMNEVIEPNKTSDLSESQPTAGNIQVNQLNLAALSEQAVAEYRNQTVGFVFQSHHLLPSCTVLENVMIPALAGFGSLQGEALENRATNLLEEVGIGHRANHLPSQISGGERQRVAVARALVNEPSVLLADEPTGALDKKNTDHLIDLLKQLNEQRKLTLLMVTHSLEGSSQMKQSYHLNEGSLKQER